jgi:hypothetical protein
MSIFLNHLFSQHTKYILQVLGEDTSGLIILYTASCLTLTRKNVIYSLFTIVSYRTIVSAVRYRIVILGGHAI